MVKEVQDKDNFSYGLRLKVVLSDLKRLHENFPNLNLTQIFQRSGAQGCYTKVYFCFKKFQHSIIWQEEMSVLQSSEKQISCLGELKTLNICTHFIFFL